MGDGYVSCPYCNDAMVHRLGESERFVCPSCGKTFTASGYALGTERPP
ncbi:MAG: hypothetical protein ACQCN6_01730 [Candidatus Bathyarchaeia archaeon]